jgi:hypothetical protein
MLRELEMLKVAADVPACVHGVVVSLHRAGRRCGALFPTQHGGPSRAGSNRAKECRCTGLRLGSRGAPRLQRVVGFEYFTSAETPSANTRRTLCGSISRVDANGSSVRLAAAVYQTFQSRWGSEVRGERVGLPVPPVWRVAWGMAGRPYPNHRPAQSKLVGSQPRVVRWSSVC